MKRFLESQITSLGKSVLILFQVFKRGFNLKNFASEFLKQLEIQGVKSLTVVFFSAMSIGMVVAVQFGKNIINNFGAEDLVGGFVAIAFFRELAPVFIALVLAGKIGAAITAEIGSMKVTEQIDAMMVFNMEPIQFLIAPRLFALLLTGPVITIYGLFIAIFSGQLFTKFILNLNSAVFLDSVRLSLGDLDFQVLLIKSLIFSLLIGSIASLNGLNTKGGLEAVGRQTTKTVVWSFLSIFISNYIITSIFF